MIVGFVLIICKKSHKINRSKQSAENDKEVVGWRTYHNWFYAVNRERILARQKRWRTENSEVLRTRCKRWYENNKGNGSSGTRDHIVNGTMNASVVTDGNTGKEQKTVKQILEKLLCQNKERIKQRLQEKKQTNQIRISCFVGSGTKGHRNWKRV